MSSPDTRLWFDRPQLSDIGATVWVTTVEIDFTEIDSRWNTGVCEDKRLGFSLVFFKGKTPFPKIHHGEICTNTFSTLSSYEPVMFD